LAVFAFATHGYASLFSISANVRSPATWPTFVDARHAVQMVVQPLAQSPVLVEQALTSLSAPSGPPTAIIAAVGRDGAARVVPPLPVQSPSLFAIDTALLPQRRQPHLKARGLETPEPARRPLAAERPGTSGIVTGSIRRPAGPNEPPVETAAGSRPVPGFDTAARSSLGGPVPTTVAAVPRKVAALPMPPANLLILEKPTSAATPRPVNVDRPGRRPLQDRRPGFVGATVEAGLAGGVAGPSGEPVLRSLGQSLAVVRRLPQVPPPSRSTLRAIKTAGLHPPLPSRMRSAASFAPAPAADNGADSERAEMAAVAQQPDAASQKRSKIRRGAATARPVTRRAYSVPRRRAARQYKAKQRSARIARRQYARNSWKRHALGDSLY